MKTIQLGRSDLHVTPICLGTMTFGEQVNEADSHAILSRSLEHGINFLDTAEMYSVPPKAETFQLTEKIVGNWLANNPGARDKLVLATKVAGPSRGMPWIRGGSPDLTGPTSLPPARAASSASRPMSLTSTRFTGPRAACPCSAACITHRPKVTRR